MLERLGLQAFCFVEELDLALPAAVCASEYESELGLGEAVQSRTYHSLASFSMALICPDD